MAGSAGARPSTESREDGAFLALDARTATDVWAAGWQARGNAIMPLVRHFDGTAWGHVTVPNIGEAQVKGIAARARTTSGSSASSGTTTWPSRCTGTEPR